MKKDYDTKKIILYMIIITSFLIIILGFLFYKYTSSFTKEKKKDNAGIIYLEYVSDTSIYSLNNFLPMKNEEAKKDITKGSYFDFSITCDVDKNTSYEVSLLKDKSSNVDDSAIHFYLEKQNNGVFSKVFERESYQALKKDTSVGTSKKSMIILKDRCSSNENNKYRLRMWVNENSVQTISNPIYKVNVNLFSNAS